MDLGTFSVSLSVKDIAVSKAFYEKLGFEALPGLGGIESKWLILKNGTTIIGLFEGMFDNNILTFNPQNAREVHQSLQADGVEFQEVAPSITEKESGPCHFSFLDPDGNAILVDQHNE